MPTQMQGTTHEEQCERCDRETPHVVRIELRAESDVDNAASREPYRVARCRLCDATTSIRMNDA
jgi:hypothetical protein